MSLIKIVCANCGAQYRLPETFQADKAKCKKCGASIDVAGQRHAPAAEPAAAASATRSSRRTARGDGEPTNERRSSRRAAGGSRRSRRGEDGEAQRDPKRKNGVLVWGSIAVLAVIVVVLIFVMQGGGEQAAKADTAGAKPGADDQAAAGAAGALTEQPAAETPPATEADAGKADAEAKEAADTTKDEAPAPKPSTHEVKSPEDVFDPQKELQPVAWPDYVTTEDRSLISQLIDDVEAGGSPGIKAKVALENMGHKALAGIVNKLREIDYSDAWESQTAYEFNKLLGTITMGKNAGFKSVDVAEEVTLEKADWNARTAKAWQQLMKDFPTKEAFDAYIAERSKQK